MMFLSKTFGSLPKVFFIAVRYRFQCIFRQDAIFSPFFVEIFCNFDDFLQFFC